jgi:hypothetical protein
MCTEYHVCGAKMDQYNGGPVPTSLFVSAETETCVTKRTLERDVAIADK